MELPNINPNNQSTDSHRGKEQQIKFNDKKKMA